MQTTLIVLIIIVAVIGFLFYMARAQIKNIPMESDNEKTLTLTDKNFQQQIKNKIVLIDFWANWCAPCRMMAPVLNEVASELEGNLYVGKVNIEQYQSLADKYNIRSIPTLILLKNGVEVNRFVGIKNKEFLIKQIQSI